MKKNHLFIFVISLFLMIFLISCERELEFSKDYNYSFEVNLINAGNSSSVYNAVPLKLNIVNLGLSDNNFKIEYVSSNSGNLSFQGNNTIIPSGQFVEVLEGEILLNYTSNILGEQTLTFNCIDASGENKEVEIIVKFEEPSYNFTQLINISSTNNNNALHEVFIENEDYLNDTYELKYEVVSMNFVQEPGTTQTEPTVIIGDAALSSIVTLQTNNTYSNISSTLIPLGNKKKIKIKISRGGYSQFQIKLTLKNSYNIEKILIFNHNGVLPHFNYVDFISRYKRLTWVPLGGSNLIYKYYSICINNAPVVTGATLQSVKILSRANTDTTYIVRYVGGTLPPNNSYSYSTSFTSEPIANVSFQVIRTILTYSNGTIYWVDKGTNYDVNVATHYGAGFSVNPCL